MEPLGNVLVVEDEETLADNLEAFLARRSGAVRVASSTHEALATLREFQPEVVVLDYCLAGMNGLQLLDHIRRQLPACGAVLITGHPSDEVLRGASERGVLDVLFKPFPLGDLEQALARARCPGPPRPAASPWSADHVMCEPSSRPARFFSQAPQASTGAAAARGSASVFMRPGAAATRPRHPARRRSWPTPAAPRCPG